MPKTMNTQTKFYGFMLREDHRKLIKKLAYYQQRSMSGVMRDIIDNYIRDMKEGATK